MQVVALPDERRLKVLKRTLMGSKRIGVIDATSVDHGHLVNGVQHLVKYDEADEHRGHIVRVEHGMDSNDAIFNRIAAESNGLARPPTSSPLTPGDLHVDLAIDAGIAAADAWVGFTAATGVASMDADVLSFAFCQWPHCGGGRPSQAGAFAVAV